MSERDEAVEAIVRECIEIHLRPVGSLLLQDLLRHAVQAGRELGLEEGRSINLLETHGGIGNAMRDAKAEGRCEEREAIRRVAHDIQQTCVSVPMRLAVERVIDAIRARGKVEP